MNGIPKSPLNRYLQVTDAVVAYNTYVNCESPWHFGVGSNVSEAAVLPKSEIRSARPARCVVANNVIYNENADARPIMAHDSLDGISFINNVIDNQGQTFQYSYGFKAEKANVNAVNDYLKIPSIENYDSVYNGFDFETITTDVIGRDRDGKNQIGAFSKDGLASDPNLLDKSKYGTSWFSNVVEEAIPTKYGVTQGLGGLVEHLKSAKSGDIILVEEGNYTVDQSLIINKAITLRAENANDKVEISFTGASSTPLFAMHPKGELKLEGITLTGNGNNYAFASLKENMSSHYNLEISDFEIDNFNYVLRGYKESMAQEITFKNTTISNCANGIELSEETNDRGDYNVEFLTIDGCTFKNVRANVIDYYRGGYDESTIGGNLRLSNSTFTSCGSAESNGILINHRGIIHVNIDNNEFIKNKVKRVSILWGAKDNHESGNKISNSGRIEVQQNLALKLMY
jgi:poly(beta-D-mannuronate) lyase